MELKVKFDDGAAKTFKKNITEFGSGVRAAMQGAAEEAAATIMDRGAADIASAGKFGGEWQEGLKVTITETQRTVTVVTTMGGDAPVSFWKVFEYGASIFAHNEKGLLTWPNTSGFSINGKVPLFISKASVTIPQKFHLRDIVAIPLRTRSGK